jgi:hypothetical protein
MYTILFDEPQYQSTHGITQVAMNLGPIDGPVAHNVLEKVTLESNREKSGMESSSLRQLLTILLEFGLLAVEAEPNAWMTVKAALRYLKESV